MRFNSISPKQAEIFKFMAEPYDALICDGTVRSGKTIMMTIAFIEWAMACFEGMSCGICGKTVCSAERNIVAPLMGIGSVRKKYAVSYSRSTSLLTVRHGGKKTPSTSSAARTNPRQFVRQLHNILIMFDA